MPQFFNEPKAVVIDAEWQKTLHEYCNMLQKKALYYVIRKGVLKGNMKINDVISKLLNRKNISCRDCTMKAWRKKFTRHLHFFLEGFVFVSLLSTFFLHKRHEDVRISLLLLFSTTKWLVHRP